MISIRRFFLVLWDILSVCVAGFFALWMRFDGKIPAIYYDVSWYVPAIIIGTTLLIFLVMKLYTSIWHYASVIELKNIVIASFLSTVIDLAIFTLLDITMPKSWYPVNFLILMCLVGASRFFYRIVRIVMQDHHILGRTREDESRVMIIGAGEAGDKIAREIAQVKSLNKQVVCFIDDMPTKKGMRMQGKPIYGNRDKIKEAVDKFNVDEIIIALPSVEANNRKEIIDLCKEVDCELKILPGIYQLVDGQVSISSLRNVEIEDLLGRDAIKVNLQDIMGYVNNKIVMVTGGGGSIGSELCRQIADKGPKQLIIVDIYENNAYDIQLELRRKYPALDLEVMIASVRDKNKIYDLFAKYQPDIVYHAAAHKHVPLMEDAPNEAVKNNVFGTLNVVKAANHYKASKFVLISTDKAVNPTNIMGATKRICEMIVQTYNKHSKTDYVAVRFGNVLGSNGSVIPLFKKQILAGGPVTVTHPEITRYFMTIPEAVSLVLQAGAYARGGEIFVLDMGKPVKIADLAYNLIKFSGYEPNVDIKIEYTGLRPGEKLYEELLMDEEGLQTTQNELIKIGKPIELDEDMLFSHLDKLYAAAYAETEDMKFLVHDLVDTYKLDIRDKTQEFKKSDFKIPVHS